MSGSMTDHENEKKRRDRDAQIKDVAMMLDCAIADGARLKLPMFVWLVRLARIELLDNLERE